VTREDRRQLIHFATTALALTLPWLPQWAAYAACGAAIAMWWIALPLLHRDLGLARDGEPFVNGLRMYPVAVLLVLVLFPRPAAVAGWAAMGVGDAASNVLGRRFGRPGFLGRADRSLVGTLAFVATAWPAAWALATWVDPSHASAPWAAALAAAGAGAAVELLPLQRFVDDNLPIALAAAAAYALVA
jgi:dolichol kinase